MNGTHVVSVRGLLVTNQGVPGRTGRLRKRSQVEEDARGSRANDCERVHIRGSWGVKPRQR